jgi:predicted nucleic acid-binding protein
MIFVDSSAWYASLVPREAEHAQAAGWMGRNVQQLLTTDYVLDETLTLLRGRGHDRLAIALGEQLFQGTVARLHFITEDEIRDAWDIFRRFSDKAWSFTDCTSKVVMERLGITTAFVFDQHFRQFGTVAVVP